MKFTTPLSYVQSKGWDYREHRDEIWTDCPVCGGDGLRTGTFAINIEKGIWNCKHGNKHMGQATGTLFQLMTLLGDTQEKEGASRKQYAKPAEVVKVDELQTEVAEYLTGRGITQPTWKKYRLTPCKRSYLDNQKQSRETPAIAFPYLRDGELMGYKYRLRDGAKKKWKNFQRTGGDEFRPTLYGLDVVPHQEKTLIMLAGEIDVLTSYELGIPAVGFPSESDLTWVEEEWDRLARFDEFIIGSDMDKAGNDFAVKVATRLGMHKCRRLKLPMKDITECREKGWGADDYQLALSESEEMKPTNVVYSWDVLDRFLELHFRPQVERYGTPPQIPGLAEYVKGWRPGGLTLWQGFNASGKSTMMLQEAGDLVRSGERVFVASFEMSPEESLEWMMPQALRKKDYTEQEVRETFARQYKNLWWLNHHGRIKPEQLSQAIQYVVQRYEVAHVFIDNLTCIGIRRDDYNAQSDFIHVCRFDIADKFGVHAHLAVHSRKALNMKAVSQDRNDVRGAGDLSDIAETVLIVKRNEEKDEKKKRQQATTWLVVDKNRHFGKIGQIDLCYVEETNRFEKWAGKYVAQNEELYDPFDE